MKIIFALLLLVPLAGCASMGEFAGGAASVIFQPHYYPYPQWQPQWYDYRRCRWSNGRRWCRR